MKINKNNIKILTPSGFRSFEGIQKLKKECLELVLKSTTLKCSLNHRVLTKEGIFKSSKYLKIGDILKTENGYEEITEIKPAGILEVFDLINVEENQYFTNNIISHNCTFDEVGESAIDGDFFEKMKKHTFDPLYVYDEGHYLMWENPNEERIYAAGVDVAEGIGKDATVIQILDITNPQRIKQVAIYHNNKLAPVEFTPKLREILQHWGDPLALIERNNCGGIVVDNLKKDFNYENIINWGIDRVVNKKSNKLGIVSHTNTKYHAILNQRYWLNTCKYVQINDINTVLELNEFVRQKNGTWGARNGEHDDRVMALCWALMILHDDIVNVYFEVVDRDENSKPAIIKPMDYGIKYFVNPSSMYTNEKTGMGGDALPMIMGGFNQNNPDLDDLSNQGWVPFM